MADDERNRSHRKIWIIAFAIPAIYVLSIGPFMWMASLIIGDRRSPWQETLAERAETAAELFYIPLFLLGDRLPWFDRFLGWYIGLLS